MLKHATNLIHKRCQPFDQSNCEMNPEHKELAEKVIIVFKTSNKDTLYFPDDLANIFPNEDTAKLVTNNLIELGLLKLISKGFFRITNKGLNFKGFTDLERNEEIENRKNILDLRLKEWQVKTFWPIFIDAIIGSGLAIYNFINSLIPSENVERLEQKIEKTQSELDKLKISMSTEKHMDSVESESVLIDKFQK